MASDVKKSKADQRRAKEEEQLRFMKERVQQWFPDLENESYFVPPLHFNRTGQRETSLEGVWETQAPPHEHAKDDAALRLVRRVLGLVAARYGPMVVQTDLKFGDYLGENAYAAAAGTLCRPTDSALKRQGDSVGDFDVLVLHRLVLRF